MRPSQIWPTSLANLNLENLQSSHTYLTLVKQFGFGHWIPLSWTLATSCRFSPKRNHSTLESVGPLEDMQAIDLK